MPSVVGEDFSDIQLWSKFHNIDYDFIIFIFVVTHKAYLVRRYRPAIPHS